jgi:hypothetical protein
MYRDHRDCYLTYFLDWNIFGRAEKCQYTRTVSYWDLKIDEASNKKPTAYNHLIFKNLEMTFYWDNLVVTEPPINVNISNCVAITTAKDFYDRNARAMHNPNWADK